MGITILLAASIYGLMICEFYIFLWFVVRAIGLIKGKTDFIVSWKVPVFYLMYSLVIGYTLVFNSNISDAYHGSPLSMAEKVNQYVFMLVLVNITTPLFPVLAYLKSVVVKRQGSVSLKPEREIKTP